LLCSFEFNLLFSLSKSIYRMKKVFLIAALSYFSVSIALAQWTNNSLVNMPVCNFQNNQKDPRIISDGEGGYFVGWKDWRNNLVPDIFIQRLDSAGNILWTSQGINVCADPADQSTPNLVQDGQGGVIISWSDWRSGVERDIYAQRLDNNGTALWAVNGVFVTSKSNREHNEKIVADNEGGCYIVWEESVGIGWDVWIQHLDSNGMRTFGPGGMALSTTTSNKINTKLQSDNNGGTIVVWQDERSGAYDVYAQRMNKSGARLWGAGGKAICTEPNVQILPKIDPDRKNGGVYICWVDKRNGLDYDLYAQRVDSNGNLLWPTGGKAIVAQTGNQSAQDILSKSEFEGLIVTWKDGRLGNDDVYAQKVDGNGNMMWPAAGVLICNKANDQNNPSISYDGKKGCIVAWQDKRDGVQWDIYAQRIDSSGNALWGANGFLVSNAVGDQKGPKSVSDGDGGVAMVWEDYRSGNAWDIYGAHVSKKGNMFLLGVTDVEKSKIILSPNPVQQYLSISAGAEKISAVDIFDVSGKHVMHIIASNNIYCGDLAKGIFMARVMLENGGVEVLKFLVD
jgi:hypothetical protein